MNQVLQVRIHVLRLLDRNCLAQALECSPILKAMNPLEKKLTCFGTQLVIICRDD